MLRKIKFHSDIHSINSSTNSQRIMKRILFLVVISLIAISCLIQAQDKKTKGYSVDSSVIDLPKFTPDEKRSADLIEYKKYDLKVDTTDIYDVVEQMPQFPGGADALMKYLTENIHYPIIAFENGVQGRVICHFIVTAKGKIDRVEILRSLDPACDKEAYRVVKSLPKFIPGKQKGVNVSVWYTLPVIFKLENAKKQYKSTPFKNDSLDFNQKADMIDPFKNEIIEKDEFIEKDGIYERVEEWPRFPGGEFALISYINKNIKYPETKKDIHGTVIVHFEVTKLGEIGRVEIFKSLDPAFDYEAVRVVKSLPKWTPGKHNGEYVNVWYNIPINFMPNQADSKSNNSGETLDIYESVKQMPLFPGGEKELSNYISKELVYPISAKQRGIQGNVYVRFVVTKTGTLDRIEVVRPLTPDCDAEAIRFVKNFPTWIPGKLGDKSVDVYYTIALPFKPEK